MIKKIWLLLLISSSNLQANILGDLAELGDYLCESVHDYAIYQANQFARLVSKPAGQYQVLGCVVVIAACIIGRRQLTVHKAKLAKEAQEELTPEELAAAGHRGSL